jgi:hypothetical protein
MLVRGSPRLTLRTNPGFYSAVCADGEGVVGYDGGSDCVLLPSREIEHIGSAHDDVELELLKAVARRRLAAGRKELDLGLERTCRPGGARAAVRCRRSPTWPLRARPASPLRITSAMRPATMPAASASIALSQPTSTGRSSLSPGLLMTWSEIWCDVENSKSFRSSHYRYVSPGHGLEGVAALHTVITLH